MIHIYQSHQDNTYLINNIFPEHTKIISQYKQSNKDILSKVQPNGLFIFHIDLTCDESYYQDKQDLIKHLKILNMTMLNQHMNDISKKHIQQCCRDININSVTTTQFEDDEELCIIKSNLNCNGIPEGKNIIYSVLPKKQITEHEWNNSELVVEKFIQNKRNIFYRIYKSINRLVISEVVDQKLIKKMPRGVKRVNSFVNLREDWSNHKFYKIIKQIRDLSIYMKIDFGTFDVVMSDTQDYYIVDVNKTPYWGEITNIDNIELIHFLSGCLV